MDSFLKIRNFTRGSVLVYFTKTLTSNSLFSDTSLPPSLLSQPPEDWKNDKQRFLNNFHLFQEVGLELEMDHVDDCGECRDKLNYCFSRICKSPCFFNEYGAPRLECMNGAKCVQKRRGKRSDKNIVVVGDLEGETGSDSNSSEGPGFEITCECQDALAFQRLAIWSYRRSACFHFEL